MTDRERALTKIDLRHIEADGRYVNFEKNIITNLTYEDIIFLRAYHNDKNIAKDYEFKAVRPLEASRLKTPGQVQRQKAKQPVRVTAAIPAKRRTAPTHQRPKQPNYAAKRPPQRSQYTLSREGKYTGKHHKGIKFPFKKVLLTTGAIFLCITFMHSFTKNDVTKLPAEPSTGIVITAEHDVAGEGTIITEDQSTIISGIETPELDEKQEMRNICEEAARIYQIDANALYETIMSNTNNLTSDEYLENYTFEGISYKGSGKINCTSPEQMVIIAARAMDQDTQRFGYDREAIKTHTSTKAEKNYDSYVQMIGHYCEILGEDPCLIYGIMKAETGWDSRLLNELNNPAGLKLNDGEWWEFDTIESGIIELILQVHSYRWSGANTVEEIASIHCPLNDPDDVNNVNQYWVGNVKDGMNQAKSIYANMNFSTGTNRL